MASALATIHTGKKALGLDEDTYRAMLERITGKTSARDLSESERRRVIEEMRRQGFKGASKGARKPLEDRFAKKLQALWIAGYNLGLIRERDDKALLAFVKRQTGIDHVRFLHDADDAAKAIEALKGWLARAGGVKWRVSDTHKWLNNPGYRIAYAQWVRLFNAMSDTLPPHKQKGSLYIVRPFKDTIEDISGKEPQNLSDSDWIKVMNALGRKIRKTGKCQP